MREEFREILRKNRLRLVNELNVSISFLAGLLSNGVINEEQKAQIQSMRTPHEKVDTLIEILGRREDRMFELFLENIEYENSDLFDLLNPNQNLPGQTDASEDSSITKPKSTSTSATETSKSNLSEEAKAKQHDTEMTSLMVLNNDDLKIKMQKKYSKIKSSVDPKGYVVDTLFEEGVITPTQLKEMNGGPDHETRADNVLSHLFQTSHPQAFVVFREALKKDYSWIVKMIDDYTDSPVSSVTEPPTNRRNRSGDTVSENDHPQSKRSSGADVSQSSSSMTVKESSIHWPTPEQQPRGTEQNDCVDIATSSSTPLVIPAGSLSNLQALGVGGYGIVYKAQHSQWGTVAYKQLHVQLIKDRDLSALKQEAEIQWKLHHPNIVQVLGIVLEIRNYGIVLEFVGKGELLDYIQDSNPDLPFKLSASYDVCLALNYLHSLSPPLIHGDLKIENILLEVNGRAKVCDFGFSKWKDYSKSHSKEEVRVGTVTHVPPELWKKPFLRKVESFDVYSYGVCLWEILVGEKPFKGSDPSIIKTWVLDNERPNLESIPSETPAQIIALMEQCWNENISMRPNFSEVKKILEEIRN